MGEIFADSSNGINGYISDVDVDNILPTHTFPDEIVEDILIRVWLSWEWTYPKARWIVYHKLLGISRQWSRITRSVALHYRVLESLVDFQVYAHLCSHGQPTYSRRYKYLRMPYTDMTLSYLEAFDMTSLMSSCAELDVSPMYDGRLWPLCRMVADSDPQLRCLSFKFEDFAAESSCHEYDRIEAVLLAPKLTSVTTLNITCTNPKRIEWIYRNVVDFKSMLLPFPNLAHLRTNIPISLLLAAEYLKSLVTLTLDVPPVYMKHFHATSILSWGLITALKTRAISPQKIIIESGPLHPIGWEQLCKVCDTLGIQTVFVSTYAKTYVVPTPVRSAKETMRYLEGKVVVFRHLRVTDFVASSAASVRFKQLPIGNKSIVSECVDRYIDRYHSHPYTERQLPTVGHSLLGILVIY